jgi:hypothetical protein
MAVRTTTAIHIDETKQVAIVMEPFRLRNCSGNTATKAVITLAQANIVTALPKYIGRMQHTDMKKTNEKFGCVMNLFSVMVSLMIILLVS